MCLPFLSPLFSTPLPIEKVYATPLLKIPLPFLKLRTCQLFLLSLSLHPLLFSHILHSSHAKLYLTPEDINSFNSHFLCLKHGSALSAQDIFLTNHQTLSSNATFSIAPQADVTSLLCSHASPITLILLYQKSI